MKKQTQSPAITSLKWGEVKTSDGKTYKDVKLYPGGSRNETGTHHKPGILPADVQELLDNEAEVLILSKGVNERLQTSDDTIRLLERKQIPFHVLQTEKAVEKYNELRKDEAVGALIHSTC